MLALLALLSTAQAAPNGIIPIQGVLTDGSGAAIDGDVSVTFRLYADDTGASSLWEDTLTVSAVSGRFAVDLGSSAALDLGLFAAQQGTHLGITVGTDSEMPLVPLSPVPYAAWAEDAGKLGGKTAQETSDDILVQTDLRYRPASENVPWSELDGIPADLADGDNDTTYDGTNFALSSQACDPGDVVAGVDASGNVTCVTAVDTQLSQSTVESYAQGVCYDVPAEVVAALDGQAVSVASLTAQNLTVRGSDFVLGTDDGRSVGSATAQRALVHEGNDELTINFNNDFEGGTNIGGDVVNIPGSLRAQTFQVSEYSVSTAPPVPSAQNELPPVGSHFCAQIGFTTYSDGNCMLGIVNGGWVLTATSFGTESRTCSAACLRFKQ